MKPTDISSDGNKRSCMVMLLILKIEIVVFTQLWKSKNTLVFVRFKRAREVWGNSAGLQKTCDEFSFLLSGFNGRVLKFLGGSPQTSLKLQRVRGKHLAGQGLAGVLLRGVVCILQRFLLSQFLLCASESYRFVRISQEMNIH